MIYFPIGKQSKNNSWSENNAPVETVNPTIEVWWAQFQQEHFSSVGYSSSKCKIRKFLEECANFFCKVPYHDLKSGS